MSRVLLLTGKPGSGKTTLIQEALRKTGIDAGGFYTEEMRKNGIRQGFRLVTLDGRSAVLAHVNIRNPHRVSKYGVDIGALESAGVIAIQEAVERKKLIVLDEIGKMELFSDKFREAALKALSSGKPVLGTIMLAPHPWADRIKRNPNVDTVNVTVENRPAIAEMVRAWLGSIEKEEEHEQDTGADQA